MDQHGSKQGVWPCHSSCSCGQHSKTQTRWLYHEKGLVAHFNRPHGCSAWKSLETGRKGPSLPLSCSIVFLLWFEWRHSRYAHHIYGGGGRIKTEEIVAIFGVRIRIQMVFTVQVSRSKPTPYDLRVTVSVFNIRKSQLSKCRVSNWIRKERRVLMNPQLNVIQRRSCFLKITTYSNLKPQYNVSFSVEGLWWS